MKFFTFKLINELGAPVILSENERLVPGSGHGHIKDPSLFSIRDPLFKREDKIHNRVVVNLTREPVPSSHHIHDNNVIFLKAFCCMNRRKGDIQPRELSLLVL
jgi:hypothetical protein